MSLKAFEKELQRFFNSRSFKQEMGKKAKDIIFKRTKSGYGVSDDSSKRPKRQRLTRLDSNYIKIRKTAKLGQFGSPSRSNATLSGQMLANMDYRATSDGFEVFIKDNRRGPVVINGRSQGGGLTNQAVAQYYGEKRPFLALTSDEQRIISELIDKLITDKFKSKRYE